MTNEVPEDPAAYSQYLATLSYSDLLDIHSHIDRQKYPDKFALVESLMLDKRARETHDDATPQARSLYKTFWRRFIAGTLDGLIFLPVGYLSIYIWDHSRGIPLFLLALWQIVFTFLYALYSILMTGRCGQTLGKMLARVRVFDVSGNSVSMSQAFRRDSVILFLDVLNLAICLPVMLSAGGFADRPSPHLGISYSVLRIGGLLWFIAEMVTMFANKRRRAVHDLIAGSVVMKVPNECVHPIAQTTRSG
jgi:uncharacterized RDD family membrane protein YckC